MMADEIAKQEGAGGNSQGGNGRGGKNGGGAAASQTDEDEGEKEEENGPEFRGLVWKKDGKETDKAMIDDDVTLFCEVKNIDEGETVKFKIFEQGKNKDDAIDNAEGEVKDGKGQAPWKIEYKEDENSNTAEEIEEQGWTIPDYYFVAEYGGVESVQSNELKVKERITHKLTHKKTGEIWANRKYTLILPDGSEITGTTDENGYIEETSSPLGEEIDFYIHEEKDTDAG
jgi:hypothetical protein